MKTIFSEGVRLPIVLVVDPVSESRFAMWRLLARRFGVLEAEDGRRARAWCRQRRDIAALVVQRALPDGDGGDLVSSLAAEGFPGARRAVVLDRHDDVRAIARRLEALFTPPMPSTPWPTPEASHLAP